MPRDLIEYPEVELDEMGLVLMRAAEIVEQGWCTGAYFTPRTEFDGGYFPDRFCMMGAILRAVGYVPTGDSVVTPAMVRVIGDYALRMGFDGPAAAYKWNDGQIDSRRVVERMRKAAVQEIPRPPSALQKVQIVFIDTGEGKF